MADGSAVARSTRLWLGCVLAGEGTAGLPDAPTDRTSPTRPPHPTSTSSSGGRVKEASPWSLASVNWRAVATTAPWIPFAVTMVLTIVPGAVVALAAQPRNRPFDVYDASISYPYLPDTVGRSAGGGVWAHPLGAGTRRPPTLPTRPPPPPYQIPAWLALVGPFILFLLTVVAAEGGVLRRAHAGLTPALGAGLYHVLDGVAALAVTLLVTEATKLGVGRLRPHFLAVCEPDVPSTTVALDIGDAKMPPCTAAPGKVLTNARSSFPSGHTSSSTCVAVFSAVYVMWAALHARAVAQSRAAGRPSATCPRRVAVLGDMWTTLALYWALLQVLLAWGVGATRITDNRHHPSDVIAGFALGAVVAAAFAARSIAGRLALPAAGGEGDGGLSPRRSSANPATPLV